MRDLETLNHFSLWPYNFIPNKYGEKIVIYRHLEAARILNMVLILMAGIVLHR